MRRPLSIMRVAPDEGWIELLYKVVGQGLEQLAEAEPGDLINLMGPIGNGFSLQLDRPNAILIGGGVGIPPLIFLAEAIKDGQWGEDVSATAFFGSELPFPFDLTKTAKTLDGIAESTNSTLTLLDDWGVPSALASHSGFEGCHNGYVTDVADQWLATKSAEELSTIMIYACGPEPMLEATQALARSFDLPSQLCLEEFMACAVGGCAGCAVRVETPEGPAMKRVCVDGPVFIGSQVY